jgi:hypothetical protein
MDALDASVLRDLYLECAILVAAFSIDLASLFVDSSASIPVQLTFIGIQVFVVLYRGGRFLCSTSGRTYEALRLNQDRLQCVLDIASLAVFVSIDIIQLHRKQDETSITVFLSGLGGVLHYRLQQVEADVRYLKVFRHSSGNVNKTESRVEGCLVLLRFLGLVNTFLWSGVELTYVVEKRRLQVFATLAFGTIVFIYVAVVCIFHQNLKFRCNTMTKMTSSTNVPFISLPVFFSNPDSPQTTAIYQRMRVPLVAVQANLPCSSLLQTDLVSTVVCKVDEGETGTSLALP